MRILVLLIVCFAALPSFSCSMRGPLQESHEGNDLPYWTSTKVAILSTVVSSVPTQFERRDNSNLVYMSSLFFAYAYACFGGLENFHVYKKEKFEKLKPSKHSPLVPAPTDPNEILRLKNEMYLDQKKYDGYAVLIGTAANLVNASLAKEPANRAISYSMAAINIGYYFLDLNGVRAYKPEIQVAPVLSPSYRGISAAFEF